MLPPFTILCLQATCYILGAVLLTLGGFWLRRIAIAKKKLEKKAAEATPEEALTLKAVKPPSKVLPGILLTLGLLVFALPFTSIFHADYARMARNYKRSRQYRAPRQQKEFDSSPDPAGKNLTEARKGFTTRLKSKILAPQLGDEKLVAPAGAELVEYPSGDMKLKAWVSPDPGDGKKHPAVVFLHGGFALGDSDWEVLAPYREAGYITITPSLRGENGNPGNFEFFYGEVSDALAAGEFVAKLPYVDSDRIHVTGHSIGGLLCVMTAESDSVFRSAAAFSPTSLDTADWIEEVKSGRFVGQGQLQDSKLLVFNPKDKQEVILRNPHEFAKQIQIPLLIYLERRRILSGVGSFSHLAKETGKPVLMKQLFGGDHMTMLPPSIEDTLSWFKFLEMIDPTTLNAKNISAAYSKRDGDTFDLAEFLPAGAPQLDDSAYRQLRFGMSEPEIEELLGEEGHVGSFERSPRLEKLVKTYTQGVLEKEWVHDSGSTITTYFDASGKLVSVSMGGRDSFFREKYDLIRKSIGTADAKAIDAILDESTFALFERRWRFKAWTSDAKVFVAKLDEQGKLSSMTSYPPIRIDYREFRGETRSRRRTN